MSNTDSAEAERLAVEYVRGPNCEVMDTFSAHEETFIAGYTAALEKCRDESSSLLEIAGEEHISRTMAQHKIRALEAKLAVAREALELIGSMGGRNDGCDYCARNARKALEEIGE